MSGTIDLHLHTNASDGTYAPRDVVRLCADMGLSAIAITDHDTMNGVPEALQAGLEMHIDVIPAIEMSAGGSDLEIHILGYFADPNSAKIQAWLEDLYSARLMRAARIVSRLREVGVQISLDDVQAIAGQGKPCCRPHIAAAMVEAGAVKDVQQAFRQYLSLGKPGYIAHENPPARMLIERMRSMGMSPVLAHGALIDLGLPALGMLIGNLKDAGMVGLECYHSSYDRSMERFMLSRAKEYGLVPTGGSDFHGANRPDVMPRSGLLNWLDDEDCLQRLRAAR